jgi:pyruvate carboxylase
MARARSTVAASIRPTSDRSVSADGRQYTAEMEDDLNRLFWLVLGNDDGRKLLAYLKNITVNTTFDHNVEPNQLMHFEGRRWLVGLMQKRTDLGEKL